MRLHQAGQRAQHTTNELFRPTHTHTHTHTHTNNNNNNDKASHWPSWWPCQPDPVSTESVWTAPCGAAASGREDEAVPPLAGRGPSSGSSAIGSACSHGFPATRQFTIIISHAFHPMDPKDPDSHVLEEWMPATKANPACAIHEDGMWLPLWLD